MCANRTPHSPWRSLCLLLGSQAILLFLQRREGGGAVVALHRCYLCHACLMSCLLGTLVVAMWQSYGNDQSYRMLFLAFHICVQHARISSVQSHAYPGAMPDPSHSHSQCVAYQATACSLKFGYSECVSVLWRSHAAGSMVRPRATATFLLQKSLVCLRTARVSAPAASVHFVQHTFCHVLTGRTQFTRRVMS